MRTAAHYSTSVVALAVTLENLMIEAASAVDYLDQGWGTQSQVDEWSSRLDAAEWWNAEWQRINPGSTTCDHGLSLQLCYDPVNHYPHDRDFW